MLVTERFSSSEVVDPERLNKADAEITAPLNGRLDSRSIRSVMLFDGQLATAHLAHPYVPVPLQFIITITEAGRLKYSLQMPVAGIVLGGELSVPAAASSPVVGQFNPASLDRLEIYVHTAAPPYTPANAGLVWRTAYDGIAPRGAVYSWPYGIFMKSYDFASAFHDASFAASDYLTVYFVNGTGTTNTIYLATVWVAFNSETFTQAGDANAARGPLANVTFGSVEQKYQAAPPYAPVHVGISATSIVSGGGSG